MIEIEMKNANGNSACGTGRCRSRETKTFGLADHIRHAMFGSLLAVASFSTALAIQPGIDAETVYDTFGISEYEVTADDLDILMPYMDKEILAEIMEKMDMPYDIIMEYINADPNFVPIADDYFGDMQ